jgi:acyl-coenzyme A thioesterase 13
MINEIAYRLKQFEGQYFKYTNSMAGKWLNYKLLAVNPGEIKASILVREEMTNPNRMIHGGMISLICDELCGLAFYSLGNPTFYTTVNLSVDYLYAAPVGSTIIIEAKVKRCGKRIANVTCSLFDEHEHIIASATSNLLNTENEVFPLAIEEL